LNRYPERQRLRAQGGAVATARRGPRAHRVLGNGSNDILELATQAFLRPGDHAVYAQTRLCRLSAGRAGAGSDRHRGCGARLRARPSRHARAAIQRAETARRVRRESATGPTGTWIAPDCAGGVSSRRSRGGGRRAGARLTRTRYARSRAGGMHPPPPGPAERMQLIVSRYVLEARYGLAARARLRVTGIMNGGGRGDAEPGAPARSTSTRSRRPGAGGARRHGVRRRGAARSIASACASSRTAARSLGPRVRSFARQLPAAARRRCAIARTAGLLGAWRDRPPGCQLRAARVFSA